MRLTKPEVYFIAETVLNISEVTRYLKDIGAQEWTSDGGTSAEVLCEIAGRLCYRSWKPGLNPNVTKVREGNREYLLNVIKQKHGSVFEHASVSFIFHNVSRVFTHELVRHRAGVAISQESLRYVRLSDLGFWMPEALKNDPEVVEKGMLVVTMLEDFQMYMANKFELDSSSDFPMKKVITSAMRRFAPIGLSTGIMWSCNLRTLRHVLELRTAKGAEEEIRLVFDKVGHIMHSRYPAVFGDFNRTEEGEWHPMVSKI